MKINDASKKSIEGAQSPAQSPAQARNGKAVAKGEAPAAPAGSVRISPQSQAFASQVAASGAVFDTAKVAEIKSAIANGTFKVNPERIADGLIDTVKDLIHQRKA